MRLYRPKIMFPFLLDFSSNSVPFQFSSFHPDRYSLYGSRIDPIILKTTCQFKGELETEDFGNINKKGTVLQV